MRLEVAMIDALQAHADLDALACVDVDEGTVITATARNDHARDAIDGAALAAASLCSAPRGDGLAEEDVRAREALVVSKAAIHAFVRVARRPERAIVAVARAGASAALVLALVRSMAEADHELST